MGQFFLWPARGLRPCDCIDGCVLTALHFLTYNTFRLSRIFGELGDVSSVPSLNATNELDGLTLALSVLSANCAAG